MLNKTTLLSILLGSTFISSPALSASVQDTIDRINAKADRAYTITEGNDSDYSFTAVEDGVTKYYKINLKTANIGTSKNISWNTDSAEATGSVKVNLPNKDNPTTLYYTESGYKEVQTNRLTSLTSDIGSADEKHLFSGLKLEITDADARGGAIYNTSTNAANIYADFIGNYAKVSSFSSLAYDSSGGAIYNSYNRTIGNITGDFIGNYASSSSSEGGAIYNEGTIGDITGDFIGNYASAYSFRYGSSSKGGAIYNRYDRTIGNITGDFIGNYASASAYYSSSSEGGAIYNSGTIGDIIGNFIGNYASAAYGSSGGAIYNRGTIGDITGDFIGNYTSFSVGAIYNEGTIGDITGDFIGNYASSSTTTSSSSAPSMGGAIYNDGTIGDITGDFIGNYVSSSGASSYKGGAICNDRKISNITGDFIGNYAYSRSSEGGAIYNSDYGTIGNITGDFIGNYVYTSSAYDSSGGAIYNSDKGKIDDITGDFIGNYASSDSSYAPSEGGAIYNSGTIKNIVNSSFINNYAKSEYQARGGAIYAAAYYGGGAIKNIVNSSFINNYAKSETGTAQGGAIWSRKNILITADNGESLFSGNYVEKAGVKTSNAIYMSDADLKLFSVNNGTITFDDGIDGNAYGIVVNGDGSGSVKFNNTVDNVKTFTMNNGSFVHLGLNGVINTETLTTSSSTSISANAVNNPIIKFDVEVDKANSKVNSGLINVSGDVIGSYNVIVNALNPEVFDNVSVAFLKAPDDDASTDSSFNIARVIGSPYMWQTSLNLNGETSGSIWYINLSKGEDKDDDVTPEVIAGIGLHEAAIEQTRSVVRNVSGKIASGREYCPGCGIYPTSWDSKALRNVWATAQGEIANIDKPSDMDAKIWGAEGGFDLQNDVNNTLGVFASYRKGEYDLSGKGSKYYSKLGSEIDIDSYLAGLYYRYDKNMNWLFATVYGGVQQADVKTDDGMSKFDSDGVELGAGLEAGHSFALNKSLTLDPSLGVYYTQISFDKAHDNVGKSYKWDDIKHVEAEAAVKLSQQFENAKVYVKPSLIQTYTDGDSVKISGLNKADTYHNQTLGRIEIGGNYGFTDSLNGYVWSNYTYGSSYDSIAAGLGINYAW